MFREMRRTDKQKTQEEAKAILKACSNGILAVHGDDGYPYGVPVSYTYDDDKIYIHCATVGHKLDAIKNDPKVSFTVVAADNVTPEKFTTIYSSVICFGKARIYEAREEKQAILEGMVDVPQGTVGELAVAGPGVMECYYNDPEATAEVLDDQGWLYTGDMAEQDEDGFIYLVDRKKDVIISGGENIYPVQIEDFLRTNEDIKDVAVIGLPDPRLGEIAAAIIELKEGHDVYEEAIEDFCVALPRYKRPRKIIFADVPRNPTGKIEKPLLRKMYNAEGIVAKEIEKHD